MHFTNNKKIKLKKTLEKNQRLQNRLITKPKTAIVIVNERTDKTADKQKIILSFAIKLKIECVSIANEHLLSSMANLM